MRRLLLITFVLLGVLAGCATAPHPAPGKVPLGDEQRRLAELFRGTPVVFQMQSDGSLRVEVPLRFSFDHGASVVKPPLAAVLDRLASSQRTQPTRLHVAAPADPGARNAAVLARDRTASTRDYLVAHGIAPTRLVAASASSDQIEIVIVD
jgi:outer membrane protein OmpA-like peptidoglycan-associated protein